MHRETSKEAYQNLVETGQLRENQKRVYEIIFDHGPLMAEEVKIIYARNYHINTISETVRNRITELVKMGLVKTCGRGNSARSGRSCLIFDVTGEMNAKPIKKKRSKKQIKKLIQNWLTRKDIAVPIAAKRGLESILEDL